MNWLDRFRRSRSDAIIGAQVRAWSQLPPPSPRAGLLDTRWVVIDVETTGFNPRRDRLLSIGAVAVENGRIDVAGSLDLIVRQDVVSDTANILVHGIGHEAQRTGTASVPALLAFLRFTEKDRLVAFHAGFDDAFLARALERSLGLRWRRPWLDLALLAPLLFPDLASHCRDLDGWLARFDIRNTARHDALADAVATAQLFLVLLDCARRNGIERADELVKRARTRGPQSGDILNFVSG